MSKATKIAKENEFKYIQLGLNIAYYRKVIGYTQEQLAEEADLSRTYLGNIEASNVIQSMSLEVLFNIAKALKVDAYKLLEFRD